MGGIPGEDFGLHEPLGFVTDFNGLRLWISPTVDSKTF